MAGDARPTPKLRPPSGERWPRCGTASARQRARPKRSTSTASLHVLAVFEDIAAERAASEKPMQSPHFQARGNALGSGAHEPAFLHHHRHSLRQRRAAHRPRLRAHRHRCDPALHAPGRARHAVRHRHGRARPQGAADRGARGRDAAGVRRRRRGPVRGDGRSCSTPAPTTSCARPSPAMRARCRRSGSG